MVGLLILDRTPGVRMIELKLSQGAKPGHGGIMPAAKLTAEIANIRGVEMGKDCVSPPWHAEFVGPLGLVLISMNLEQELLLALYIFKSGCAVPVDRCLHCSDHRLFRTGFSSYLNRYRNR